MVWQLLKMDEATISLLGNQLPPEISKVNSSIKSPLLFNVDPIQFTHAYKLLGANSSQFGYDLSLYLATVNTYFENSGEHQPLQIPQCSQDFKKRLSEDLGVAMAALFMVKAFNIDWRTISQIPANNKLIKKRPDFEAFDYSGRRFIFEAKGTTRPSSVETCLTNAIEQAKGYSEAAERKLAIVSFFSADSRIFDSATFIVDPALPDIVPPDKETSILLHYERVLQFSGLSQSAVEYTKELSKYLRKKTKPTGTEYLPTRLPDHRRSKFWGSLELETERSQEKRYEDKRFLGSITQTNVGNKMFSIYCGVSEETLNAIGDFDPRPLEAPTKTMPNKYISIFSDGTLLEITIE